jgi:uncharacterized protein (TIGR02996 family)
MTPAEQVFLDDVLANPGDDTVRRIYSDWLADHGQPAKAEFIRIQMALHREKDPRWRLPASPENDRMQDFLRERTIDLLWPKRQFDIEGVPWYWTASIDPLGEGDSPAVYLRRGFVAEVLLPLAAWQDCGMKMVVTQPLEVVSLSDRKAHQMPLGRNSGVASWCLDDGGWEATISPNSMLPADLYGFLPSGSLPPGFSGSSAKVYADAKEANAALSVACLDWARWRAALLSAQPPMHGAAPTRALKPPCAAARGRSSPA